jgi:hypothetical protein
MNENVFEVEIKNIFCVKTSVPSDHKVLCMWNGHWTKKFSPTKLFFWALYSRIGRFWTFYNFNQSVADILCIPSKKKKIIRKKTFGSTDLFIEGHDFFFEISLSKEMLTLMRLTNDPGSHNLMSDGFVVTANLHVVLKTSQVQILPILFQACHNILGPMRTEQVCVQNIGPVS